MQDIAGSSAAGGISRACRGHGCEQRAFALPDHPAVHHPAVPTCKDEPSVHHRVTPQGAVNNMLEELAEAALFDAWLREGRLLSKEMLLSGQLTCGEYLGGVCDLVGEIGRFAVRRATTRPLASSSAME